MQFVAKRKHKPIHIETSQFTQEHLKQLLRFSAATVYKFNSVMFIIRKCTEKHINVSVK